MSTKPTTTPDELHDRITDQALSELLGEQSPPDLTQRILAAAGDAKVDADRPTPVPVETEKKAGFRWKPYVTAACLLVGLGTATMLALPALQPAREAARRPEASNEEILKYQGKSKSSEVGDYSMTGGHAGNAGSLRRSHELPDSTSSSLIEEPPAIVDYRKDHMGHKAGSEVVATGQETKRWDSRGGYWEVIPNTSQQHGGTTGIGGTSGSTRSNGTWDRLLLPSDREVIRDSYRANAGYVRQRGGKVSGGVDSGPHGFTSNLDLRFRHNSFGRETTTGNRYGSIVETPFLPVLKSPLSTFSIDVDTASYANVRRYLLQGHSLPPAGAVRIEELVNYFDYDYAPPRGDHPFAAHVEVAGCPWQPDHRLVRVALKGKEIDQQERPESNLVFLLDVSGSMNSEDKLPLLKQGMQMLVRQLGENDRVAIVVYAGSEGLALPSTRGHLQQEILASLEKLNSGGSTNGGAGITLAYKIAQENYIEGGANRVILCTDGDFNVGTTGTEQLKNLVAERAKSGVFLSVLGFGRGNLNDEMMESISNRGNGNYSYIDNLREARKVLVSQMSGTLVTIAKDVKIQIEFNPAQVQSYRLIGYENRMLAAKDFNDDKKDAGEIGAGHTVTALYEIVPVGKAAGKPAKRTTDALKYQPSKQVEQEKPAGDKAPNNKLSKELLTLKLRYKQPEGRKSQLMEVPVTDSRVPFARSSKEFQFAAAVASFGMLLRGSEHRGSSSYSAVEEIAAASRGKDRHGYRAEFLDIVRRAKSLER